MKDTVKAALLSALVLPGVGQLYRGRRLKGGILVLSVTLLLIAALVCAAMVGQDIVRTTGSSGPMDPVAVAARLRDWLTPALWLLGAFLCLWLYGVADALLDSGNRKDPDEKGDGHENSDANR